LTVPQCRGLRSFDVIKFVSLKTPSTSAFEHGKLKKGLAISAKSDNELLQAASVHLATSAQNCN